MNEDILITVGIPTFNGGKYIKEAIDSVLAQLNDEKAAQIEILISDNGSTDNAPKIISEYVEKYPNLLRYYRNEKNIGYDLNVDLLFKCAGGKYLWLLGDDDYLCIGSIAKVFNVIHTYRNLSVLLLSVGFLDIETNQSLKIERQFAQDLFCKTGDDFFKVSKWATAAMSSLIIKRSNWSAVSLNKYVGSQWIHIGGILSILKNVEARSYVFHEEMVVVRTNNSRWTVNNGNQFKLGLLHLLTLKDMLYLGYDKSSYDFFLKHRFTYNLRDMRMLCHLKNINEFFVVFKLMCILFKRYPSFWFLHLPFFVLLSMLRNFKA